MRGTLAKWLIVFIGVALVSPLPAAHAEWTYTTSENRMDGTVFRFAHLESSDLIAMQFPYKTHRPVLVIRTKDPADLAVMILFSGQAQGDTLEGGDLRAKFDSGRPGVWRFGFPNDRRSGQVFLREVTDFFWQVRTSKHLLVELPIYGDGAKTFAFDLSGLDIARLGMKTRAPKGKKE